MEPKKLGLMINPIAGMGGAVGLKGTDQMVAEARRRGAVPMANQRARTALTALLGLRDQITVYPCPGGMGGALAQEIFLCPSSEGGVRRGHHQRGYAASCAADG